MAQKFSLALYQLSINRRRNRDEQVVLSDFMNGTDMLDVVRCLLDTLRYDSTNEGAPQNRDVNKFFRIMKRDGMDLLSTNGRYISGIIETGDYGTEENMVNVQTGEATHTKSINEALLVPFYFLFYIPRDSRIGFLLLQRIGNLGVYSLFQDNLRRSLDSYVARNNESNFVLKINPLVLQRLINRHLEGIGGGAKKITFERLDKEDLKVSRMTGNEISDDKVRNTELVYTAKRNETFNIRRILDRMPMRSVAPSNVFSVEGIEYSDVKFEVEIGRQTRQLSVKDIEKLGTFMDITESVELAQNGYPTYESLNREAHLLITHILEEIERTRLE